MKAKDFRRNARENLAGKWGKAALIALLYLIIFVLFEDVVGYFSKYLKIIIGVIAVFISPVITYGITASYMNLKNGESVGCLDFLKLGFQNFLRAWELVLNVCVRMLGYIIVSILFMALISLGAFNYLMVNAMVLLVIAVIGFAAFVVLTFEKAISYTLTTYIAIDKPEMSVKEVLDLSENIMKGKIWKYVYLILTFMGWAILAGFVGTILQYIVGIFDLSILNSFVNQIGMIFLLPYTILSSVAFYENNIISKKSEKKEETVN